MFKLVIQDDEGKTTVVPLIRDEITIGRKEGNTIRLTERNVSRRHARIARVDGDVTIEDLGSYNGIRVNNQRIPAKVALRISDQVQIGDYKLYLKAEGLEAEDDGRTIPVERIDGSPTQVMQAMRVPGDTRPPHVGPPSHSTPQVIGDNDPTKKMPAADARKVVGDANRTLVAMEGGAAAVVAHAVQAAAAKAAAAATAPAPALATASSAQKHARLVVLSSNFAGEEYQLARPQLIIGRTPDNDLVIDHKSISRNHAKVVREADTGRYTISDLQSANGVRVNGHDYPKVELRRGDIVDLGHVRLRFVDAGEDFVFDRDAVVSETPIGGAGKGTWIAVALAAAVLGGVGLFALTRGGKKPHAPVAAATIDAGTGMAVLPADAATTPNLVTVDAAGATVVPIEDNSQLATRATACSQLVAAEKWQDLRDCGDALATLTGGAHDGKTFVDQASREQANLLAFTDVEAAKTNGAAAAAAYKKLKLPSVYEDRAREAYGAAMGAYVDVIKGRAGDLARQNKCAALKKLVTEAGRVYAAAGDAARGVKCTDGGGTMVNPTTPVLPPKECNADALIAEARGLAGSNQFGPALRKAEDAMKCPSGATKNTFSLAALYACRAKNVSAARRYIPKSANPQGSFGSCRSSMPDFELDQ